MQSEEATAERYWTVKWGGAEGSEVVVDLWSGAVGVVHRDSGSEECVLNLPELRAKMQKRFGYLVTSYPRMKDRVIEEGYGASCLPLPCVPVNLEVEATG